MQSNKLCFIRVVEAGSFRKAAAQLKVEPSTVSRKVAKLEEKLNARLLNRTPQCSTPTELGWIYYERLIALMSEQAALDDEIGQGVNHIKGALRIAAPVDFGTHFVLPVCQKLQQQFPNLNITLELGSEFRDLLENNLDVAVRVGNLSDSSLIAKRIGDIGRVLVASPDYLARYGTPTTPENLYNHKFVFYSEQQRKRKINFLDGSEVMYKDLHAHFTVNSVTAIRQLIADGAGIHLGPYWFFAEAIKAGIVKTLLPAYPLQSFAVQCVYTSRDYLPVKVREFNTLMLEHLEQAATELN